MVVSGRLWLLNMFKTQRQHLTIQMVALGLTNIRTTLHNVVLTRNSAARISKVARWFASLYVCVVRPWECCKTYRIWSCNVVLALHVICPLIWYLIQASYISDQTWLSREDHRCCYTNTSSPDGVSTRTMARNHINARSIVRSPDYPYDAVFHRITLALLHNERTKT